VNHFNQQSGNALRKNVKSSSRNGSILVGVLWCLALLSVVVVGILHTTRLDLMVVKNHGDRIQARYLALAGVEKDKALLYHDMLNRRNTGKSHTSELYNSPKEFRDVEFGRGKFRVFRSEQSDEGQGIVYGISDEESRLNVNTASPGELAKLPGMTPDVIAAILDWRDKDNSVTPSGAEADYYVELKPPCLPRNGPLQTIRELLMIRGVERERLLGDDVDQNGLLDSEGSEEDGSSFISDRGWSEFLTVNSAVQNLNASGKDRVNIQSADEHSLTSIRGITAPMAKAIIASRNQEEFKSVADLLDVTEVQSQPAQQPGRPNSGQTPSRQNPSGPRAVSDDLFMDIADDVTVVSKPQHEGLININTASPQVLVCLGLTPELAQAIVSHRKSSGFFPNVAGLLKVPGMNKDTFKQVAPRVTARSETLVLRCFRWN